MGRLRRRTELGLIILSGLITGGAYVLASLGRTATLPANIGPFLAVVFALIVLAHIAVRRLAHDADPILLPVAGLLNGLGYVMISRLNHKLAVQQATWTAVAIAAFVATLVLVPRVRDLQRYRYTLGALAMVLLILPLVPGIGETIQGARVWIHLGPLSFQPGEFAKIALVVFFAGYLVEKRELLGMATWPRARPLLPDPKHLGPVLIAWLVCLGVLFVQRDLGQSLILFTLFIAILWISTERAGYLAVGVVLLTAGAALAYRSMGHVRERVTDWLNPWTMITLADGSTTVKGYQIVQGAFAMAAGGVAGTGLGLGKPQNIPVVYNDFIFAAFGEELGLLGVTVLIVAYLMIIGAGLRIATRAHDPFEKLMAAGLTLLLGFQTFLILAGVTRLLPLTGVALPFVSYGGSALVASYVLLALLIRISHAQASTPPAAARSQAPVGVAA
ncbi:MAG TPA: FtsW/RodA/SpoVE family cell cycle protein [Acidimicrobiales bacterium]|jgi:peptidoglycan glycosyltransferase|nr:FtsW/RodA/SpoVE family cell cycle protein [Acidimicrobiales bacterium]